MFNYLLINDKLFIDYEKLGYIVAVTLLDVSNRLSKLENLSSKCSGYEKEVEDLVIC